MAPDALPQEPDPAGIPPVDKPRPEKKICILGTAPQWQGAPFGDPSWEIWGIFGLVGVGKRLDKVFELHDRGIIEPMIAANPGKNYWPIVNALGENYITKDEMPEAPKARRFDFDAKIKKYGNYFASSASWLIAEAIDQGATHIALWGINMAADSEYAYQKPSCCYMLGIARGMGIQITVPDSSELLSIPYQYGLQQMPKALQALELKEREVTAQMEAHRNNQRVSELGAYGAQQALEILKWVKQNWK